MTKPIQIKKIVLGEGIPKICVPLTASTDTKLFEEAKAAKAANADLVEWRADFFENLSDKGKIAQTAVGLAFILGDIPLLFTIRTDREGGQFPFDMKEYAECNIAAARTGKVSLVDVEVFYMEDEKKALVKELQKNGALVIASSHDFEKTDKEEVLIERFKTMDETGADILKIAVMPKTFEDTAAIIKATSHVSKNCTEKPLISMSMGEIGSISRISGESFGSCVTFGVVGKASAPGQLPIEKLRMMMQAIHENQ